jgi:hypothetical protein
MDEAKRRSDVAVREVVEALALETAGGPVQVRWSREGAATGSVAKFEIPPRLGILPGDIPTAKRR